MAAQQLKSLLNFSQLPGSPFAFPKSSASISRPQTPPVFSEPNTPLADPRQHERNPFDDHLKNPSAAGVPSAAAAALDNMVRSASIQSLHKTEAAPEHRTTPPVGLLCVKIIQARNLNVSNTDARPYVVVQFDQNEFISREPVDGTVTPGAPMTIQNVIKLTSSSRSTSSTNLKQMNRSGSGSSLSKLSLSSPHNNPVWKHEAKFDVLPGEHIIYISVWDRAEGREQFLGKVDFHPRLNNEQMLDQWFKLLPAADETITGDIRIQIIYEQIKRRHLMPKDFKILKMIGKGTFGKVYQVRKTDTKRIYAMKVLSKKEIIKRKEVDHTIGERNILVQTQSPFLVGLKFSFQTDMDLYLIVDYKSGGELFYHLQKEGRFPEPRAKFYIAELTLALEHLHKYNIIYRDLKPENILLDATGHVALCDFGLSKANLDNGETTNTFCGTTEYLAAEVLLDEKGYTKSVDWWALGVLLWEMVCGWSPFYDEDTQQMYKNICFGKIKFPRGVITEEGKQFVKGLLNRNPRYRLGGSPRDAAEVKEHAFFDTISWEDLKAKRIEPPFKPTVSSELDTGNFDREFTDVAVENEPSDEDQDDDFDDGIWLEQKRKKSDGALEQGVRGMSIGSAGGSRHSSLKNVNGNGSRSRAALSTSPITSSLQDQFMGFTYHAESYLGGEEAKARFGGRDQHDDHDDEDDDDGGDLEDVVGSRRKGKRASDGAGRSEVPLGDDEVLDELVR